MVGLAAVGVVVAATNVLALAGVARAVSSTTCVGSSSISYSPGLTFAPRTVQYTESDTFSSCVSTDPTLGGGTSSSNATFPGATCLAPPGVFADPAYTISWNNGQHSVVELTFTDVVVGGTEQVTGTGPVISGAFQGGNATIVWLYPVLNPLHCATSQGVTHQSGPVAAQITAP
ncbi:MAG TPA: hypothetical protein VGX25_26045 [Actinophytocola sp.]|uniref:hypothetical protein n=1 Tax=Actinophytocola sp. TaxID=1872138 RepID=UPI002DDD4C48|nr:hypothetical protein [Actinophytocola sp.]HEV2782866.1 hypothetical protein [Actinophytocola sp.]